MRLTTLRIDTTTRAAIVEGDATILLDHADVGAVLRSGADLATLPRDGAAGPSFAAADLAPLVLDPGKIVCVGHNYREHIAEMGTTPPSYPTLFAKFTTALIGARDAIVLPPASVSTSVDWETELAVIIGSTIHHADAATAGAAIAGYTIAGDVSVRDWQRRTSQFLQGKTFDNSTPLGPVLVTVDELGLAPKLAISTTVDRVTKQDSTTGDLLFSVLEIVQYVSTCMTLNPGDVILTGTPSGVGAGRTPQEFLRSGQVLVSTIAGIGSLENSCVDE